MNIRTKTQFCKSYCLLIMLLLCSVCLRADSFTDFIPKYRKFKSHYQIDKIEYNEKRTVLFFRYIVQEDGDAVFYSSKHPNSWYLRTPPRMRGVEIVFKQQELKNLRINKKMELEALVHAPEMKYSVKRGDIITYELHFVRIPRYIRMLDLIEGEDGDLDQTKLNCFDIMIKTASSPLLGKQANHSRIVSKFDNSFSYAKVQPKEPIDMGANTSAKTKENDNKTKPQALSYMPKRLTSIADLKCEQRIILPKVVFRDNSAKFEGRVKALQNIKLIYDYLVNYPEMRIYLHGHTDIHGNNYDNMELSRERVLVVKRELVRLGVSPNRVEIYFYGGNQPLPEYKNGGKFNRRVEVEPKCNPN